MLLSNIDIGNLDCLPAPDDDRPRRAERACVPRLHSGRPEQSSKGEGAARGVGTPASDRAGQPPPRLRQPAVAPRAKAGVWGGAPLRT
jgi:hypothetical protein